MGLAATTGAGGHEGVTRTEYFRTEYEALQRARQLLEDGDHHAVSLCDSSGSVLAGIRLQFGHMALSVPLSGEIVLD
jgi:hypothetical protein